MVEHKPYRIAAYSAKSYTAWYVALMMSAGLLFATCAWQMKEHPVPLKVSSGSTPAPSYSYSSPAGQLLPAILSQGDVQLYQAVFAAQKKGDWHTADASIDQLHDKLLLGYVLAQRYLSHHYSPTPDDLSGWLAHYSDLPQAADIYSMAIARSPALKKTLQPVHKQATLDGYGDDIGLSVHDNDAPYVRMWNAGLSAWKSGNKAEAALLFSSLSNHHKDVSPWTASAAAYWAWRSYNAIGNHAEAMKYLRLAAQQPRSFYGILARKQLREDLQLDSTPIVLADTDVLEMIGEQPVRRAIALAQIGMEELAEKELRAAFPQADDQTKLRLLALSHDLGLASVQISMAKMLSHDGRGFDFARYPTPSWHPEGGFTVDPALIFALMRQESGFRASAVSPGGALGLMQLMPKTARLVSKGMNNPLDTARNFADPEFNMTLGQNYVRRLMDNELVNGNLIYLLAAYNAGPGRLQEWKQSIGSDDPLLFVESIPIAQTRYYVMQVMTNYWIYSEMSGSASRSIFALLHGQFPSYDDTIAPIAERIAAANTNG